MMQELEHAVSPASCREGAAAGQGEAAAVMQCQLQCNLAQRLVRLLQCSVPGVSSSQICCGKFCKPDSAM